ncbi:MAG: metal ABC transporter permease, partial [Alphaproteobacteria bacterium]
SGMFGVGIVMYIAIQTEVHLDHILFGDMLGVSWRDVLESGMIAALCGGITLLKCRDLMLYVFDESHARAIGMPTRLLHYGLLALLSLAIVGALKAVGIILAIAMLVAPGAIAFLLTRRFGAMMMLALAIALGATFSGVYASFFIDSAPAPTIVLLMTAIFIAVFAAQQLRVRRAA